MAAGRSQCILPGTGHRLVLTSLVKHTDANTCYKTNAQKTKNKTSAALLHTCIQYKIVHSMEQHRWAKMYSSTKTMQYSYTQYWNTCSRICTIQVQLQDTPPKLLPTSTDNGTVQSSKRWENGSP